MLGVILYFVMKAGPVPLITGQSTWTTPIFLSGYQSTGSVAGAVLQMVNLAVSTVIYIPFVRMSNRSESRQRLEVFEDLKNEIPNLGFGEDGGLLGRMDKVGELSRALPGDAFLDYVREHGVLKIEHKETAKD